MIRAITLGLPLFDRPITELGTQVQVFSQASTARVTEKGWPIRTTRFCLPPLGADFETSANRIPSIVQSVARLAEANGVRWFCLPVDLTDGGPSEARRTALLETLLRENRLFTNLMVSDGGDISVQGAADAAHFILSVSRKSRKGYDNFRVGASCGCLPNTPFFPFSRHASSSPGFSVALETAEIALKLAKAVHGGSMTLEDFRAQFTAELSDRLLEMDAFATALSTETGVAYAGLDASLAPFPDGETSVGRLLELLGADPFGAHGTVFLTALLTDCIKTAITKSQVRTTGFNGVMYSVLEDDILARATRRRSINIASLNLLSTMCGCGLDMVPVPGDLLVDDITGIIMDTATLATRLNKPLGVRILPIPDRTINEYTEFNMEFLCDARVLNVSGPDTSLSFDQDRWSFMHPNPSGTPS
ncbi:MAG: DUF711 family protein [Pseudomonadota bacterium]